jgi:hypothetical protein
MTLARAYEVVDRLLSEHEVCRNDDNTLIRKAWDFDSRLSASSLLRARRIIQNSECRWLPTLAVVIRQRRMKQEKIIDYLRSRPKLFNEYYGVC